MFGLYLIWACFVVSVVVKLVKSRVVSECYLCKLFCYVPSEDRDMFDVDLITFFVN